MYDRILMAVDRSDVAGRVINAARELASLSDGEVCVLHLREMEAMSRAGFMPIESDAETKSIAEHAAKELYDAGAKTHCEGGTRSTGRRGVRSWTPPVITAPASS